MIAIMNFDYKDLGNGLFECLSNKSLPVITIEAPVQLGYMVTIQPRNNFDSSFSFVNTSFQRPRFAFSQNQFSIINVASEMFSQSEALSPAIEKVLNITFTNQLKIKPSLRGRK